MPDAPRASHADGRPGVVWRGVARSGIALLMIGWCTCLNRYLLGTSSAEEPAARPVRALARPVETVLKRVESGQPYTAFCNER